MRERVAQPLGLSVVEAADGIFRLVNANMANAIRKATARRGVDPRGADAGRLRRQRPRARRHAGRRARHPPHPRAEAVARVLGARAAPHRPRGRRDALLRRRRRRAVDLDAREPALRRDGGVRARARSPAAHASGSVRVERMAALCYPGQTFDMPVPLAGRSGPRDRAHARPTRSSASTACTRSCTPTPAATRSRSCAACG